MKSAWLLLAVLLVLPFARAEDDLPGDVRRVTEQRDAAIEKINKTYVQELEKLKLSYTKQGNLDVANKIVKMIENTQADDPNSLVGKWRAGRRAEIDIKSGGEATYNGKIRGKWTIKISTFVVEWDNGFTDSYELPPAEGVLTGKNNRGEALRITKIK